MLIKALCDYYDILSKNKKITPVGYSEEYINYIVCLAEDGKIDKIIECEKGTSEILPERVEIPAIYANIIEHRPKYIFGLNFDEKKKIYTINDKSTKSHNHFKKENIDFLEDINSPVVNAYRNFILNWKPENECENPHLMDLCTKYEKSKFVFCLSGEMDLPLHKDEQVIKKWLSEYEKKLQNDKDEKIFQCAISGEEDKIARIHKKIKGVKGGQQSGTVLVSFNNDSDCSYGNEQSYNSNISETAMKKYTKALNFILSKENKKELFDDITVTYWAMDSNDEYDDFMSIFAFGDNNDMNAEETENMLKKIISDAKDGCITYDRVSEIIGIDSNVDFYMVGIKPNVSRLSVKFIYKRKFADILINIGKHQNDMQITKEIRTVSLRKIKEALLPPKSKNVTINPALFTKIFEAMIYGTDYPQALLYETVRRVKTDKIISSQRAGIIKACINRKLRTLNKEEELKVALDKENKNQAYLCGRLFAVLEKLQQDVSGNSLNTTIKDAYFASASSKPATVFPKLIRLAQNHLKKSEWKEYYNGLIGEIIDYLDNEFPDNLLLAEQGKFIIGYYQQYQDFFTKKDNKDTDTHKDTEEE